eukprot:CAMPEP_0115679246 /NCGR_PEP_ID=MMETSP0272-20121206/56179_1 /TAXON_ID=71861 /ORGANISM="Scrippsiella trochoidea, Strain CCMP3099" /LENGTH=76 /DNA_ID=CAMNT_0003118463 /DNA_START=1 /DNA_END=228 /DNA_ORIENTATION=-
MEVAEFSAALAAEVEEREDDEDWEMEDWGKAHMVRQLKTAAPRASLKVDAQKAFLRFVDLPAGTVYEAVDLTVGVE